MKTPGYTMVAIVIFMLLLSISLMAVSPAVSKIMQREREEELIFRGKQYAQAIVAFQKRQGRLPLKLKELMLTQPRSARQLFKEPMCNCDDWGLIHVGDLWPPPKVNPGDPAAGMNDATGVALPDPSAAGGRQRPGQPGSPLPSSYTQPPPSGTGAARQRPGNGAGFSNDAVFQDSSGEKPNAPIIGVHSNVHKKGLRAFKGEDYYDFWGFLAGQNNDDLPGGMLLPPGQPRPNPTPPGHPRTSSSPPN